MSENGHHGKEETFEQYRDRHNGHAEETAFLRSLGLVAPTDDGTTKKTKSIRDQVGDKISQALAVVDQSLCAAFEASGVKADPAKLPTVGLRELLLKDLTPLLKKDKPDISMMDLSTLGLNDESKIRGFLQRHGINLDKPVDLHYALSAFNEAVQFYDDEIASGNGNGGVKHPQIHRNLRKYCDAADIYNVFKTSAGHGIRHLTPQACALLRIVMAIDFLQKDPHISALPQVQAEIKSSILRHVRKVGNTSMYHSGNPMEKPIPLISAQTRVKERNRIIMKLLHKPSNSTSEVLDHVGCRFVTESANDTLRLIYQMFFDNNSAVLPCMNIRIGKTKQSLVNRGILMAALQDAKKADQLFAELSELTINHQDVQSESLTGTDNAYSSDQYRAIHITVDFPVMVNGNPMFFPTEIQFVDKTAQRDNDTFASHPNYVAKQREAATERVLGNNLHTNFQNRRKNGNGHKHLRKVRGAKKGSGKGKAPVGM